MASLGDVGDALRRVLDAIDRSIAAHHHAADLAAQARDLLTIAGAGTFLADVEHTCALFTRVIEGINEPEGQVSTLATAADVIRSYLRRHGIAHEASSAAPNTVATPAAARPSVQRPAAGSREHAEALRAELPPPVERATGQKTHGRWFANGRDEVEPVVSGEDEDSAAAWRILQETRFPGAGPPITITHAELKVAAQMRQKGVKHATLIINYRPCARQLGCDTLLPVMLPEGYSLTVYGPNYRKTFTGGARAPWQR